MHRALAVLSFSLLASAAAWSAPQGLALIAEGSGFGVDDAVVVRNDSTAGERIVRLEWDLRPVGAFFDTAVQGPGVVPFPLTVSATSADVGALLPTDDAVDGQGVLRIDFTGFEAGERFVFGIDVDLLACADCSGPAGEMLRGSRFRLAFEDAPLLPREGVFAASAVFRGFAAAVVIDAASPSPIPEPSTSALAALGLGLLGWRLRRR